MSDLIKIDRVEPREGFWVRISFSDGAVKDVDVANVLARGGVFAAIQSQTGLPPRIRSGDPAGH
jgi:hypothetical protein